MKKLTMTVAMFVTVMSAAFASGNGSKSVRVNVVPGNDQVYKVIYSAEESNVVKIRIKDEAGNLIRTDRVKSIGGFLKPYDMSSLEDGKYTLEISDKLGTVSEEIEIKSSQISSLKSLEKKRYKLTVTSEKKEELQVAIFDELGVLVHEEKHNDTKGFSRIYDLSKFDSNEFIFELNGQNSSQKLSIE